MPWYLELRQSFCISKLSNWNKIFQTIFLFALATVVEDYAKCFSEKLSKHFKLLMASQTRKKISLSSYTLQI